MKFLSTPFIKPCLAVIVVLLVANAFLLVKNSRAPKDVRTPPNVFDMCSLVRTETQIADAMRLAQYGMTNTNALEVLPYPKQCASLEALVEFARLSKFAPGRVTEWIVGERRAFVCLRCYGASGRIEDWAIYTHLRPQDGGEKLGLFMLSPLPPTMHAAFEQDTPGGSLKVYTWNPKTDKKELFLELHEVYESWPHKNVSP